MNKKLYIVLTVLSIIFLSIGGTFAYFTTSATATNITQIKSGNLTMTISGGGNQSVSFVPSKCTDENTIKRTITAKTTNTSGGKVSFSIGLNITELSDTYKKNTIRYALTTNASSCNVGIVAGGNFKDRTVGEDIWLIKNDYDNITKSGNTYTKIYYLYIWLDESETEYFDGSISVKLKGTSSNNPNLPITDDYDDGNGTNTLFYQIKNNADKYTRIDFSKQSSEDGTKGIYTTTNTENGVPVYYYRGAVDNNHVIFANFCWRIIRTTETGGVKLIYDGVPINGECNNTGEETTIGSYAFNTNHNSPAYIGYMYNMAYEADVKDITTLSGSVAFGNDVTYDADTNKYTLINTYTLTDPSNWENEYSTIANKYHYTCFNSNINCQSVYYMHNIYSKDKYAYYFILKDGKKPIDLLNEMFEGNINVKESNAKIAIDTWYKDNITSYISQLEDTIFCNDRSYDIGINTSGWNKDYSNYDKWLWFGTNERITIGSSNLICPREIDKFTVSADNGNGDLTYSVGMITVEEMTFAGGVIWHTSTSNYLYNGINNLTFSPSDFHTNHALNLILYDRGSIDSSSVGISKYLRPVISLKKGTVLSSGSGTATDPFIVG